MRKRQRRGRADGAEQIGVVVALVGRLARARSPSRPLPHAAVVLADAGLVFTGEFSCQDRIERALRWSRNGSRGGLLWIGDRQRQPPAQAVQLCDEMGRQRAAVARSKRPHVGVPGTERRPLPNALGGERRGDAIFAAHALLHQEFPLPMGRFRVFLFHGRHDHGPAGTGIAGKLCGQDAKEPDSVQPVGFSAPGASGDQDAGRRQRG
jgi:hypothetical protein